MREVLSSDTIVRLLKTANHSNLRPVECAVNNGILSLAKVYLFTPGMYVIREEDRGIVTYQWIDVTEYEDFGEGNRRDCSPLFCLTLLDRDRLVSQYTTTFFVDPFFLSWIENKIKCGIIPAIWYMMMRTFLIGMFLVVDLDTGESQNNISTNSSSISSSTNFSNGIFNFNNISTNSSSIFSSTNFSNGIFNFTFFNYDTTEVSCADFSTITLSPFLRVLFCIILIIQTTWSLGIDIYDFVAHRPRKLCLSMRIDKKRKNVFLQYAFYRTAHSIINVTVCLRALISLFGLSSQNNFINYTRIVSRTFLWWSILYFIQLVPGADYFVIAIQSMLGILSQFCLIYVVFLFGYTQLFTIAINVNLKQGCATQFSDFFTAGYSTFLAMINMLDFTQFDVVNPYPLYLIQTFYVLFVGILLLNFLIAIMSDRIAETSKYKKVILPIQKLSVVLTMERQLRWILGRSYYRWIQRRVYTVYNDRLCIVRAIFNRGNDDEHRNGLGGFYLPKTIY